MSKGKLLAVCVVWLLIVGALALSWRFVVRPLAERSKEAEEEELLDKTGASSRYDHRVKFALDSFSGYCILRSSTFRDNLANRRIRIDLQDDGADHSARIESLRSGEVQLAAFTVDSLIKVSAKLGEIPATIVAVIDETRGADAVVGYKAALPNIDALNDPEVRFVLTPDSPSETLARVVMTQFNLVGTDQQAFVAARDAEDVFRRYRQSRPDSRTAFVLWEPYVSRVLENDATHVLIDSSRFRGYIVDVIVASRDFLVKNPDVVKAFVEEYFNALHHHRHDMLSLVLEDADGGLSQEQAKRLAGGIWWKNSRENFAHFGWSSGRRLQHMEDMIGNITQVLLQTEGIAGDPTLGRPHLLYYDKTLRQLLDGDFQPGGEDAGAEEIRDERIVLPELTQQQWNDAREVGTLGVPPLAFATGTSRLIPSSKPVLQDLVQRLESWPQYYLLIRGNAARRGDPELNRQIALQRAEAARDFLLAEGVDPNRLKAVASDPSGNRSVTFVFCQSR